MEKEMEKDFETLYNSYWKYVYKWEVGHEEDFKDMPIYHKNDFREQLSEEGMVIKVREGY